MDQSEKIALLEKQIKNLEKIIELQDKLIVEQTGLTHIAQHWVCNHEYPSYSASNFPRKCLKCGTFEPQFATNSTEIYLYDGTESVAITDIGQD